MAARRRRRRRPRRPPDGPRRMAVARRESRVAERLEQCLDVLGPDPVERPLTGVWLEVAAQLTAVIARSTAQACRHEACVTSLAPRWGMLLCHGTAAPRRGAASAEDRGPVLRRRTSSAAGADRRVGRPKRRLRSGLPGASLALALAA